MSQDQDAKIVKLNVGGTRYEVARSLIEMHPDTMLAKIVSKEWQDNPSAEIFIERDGGRFKYVLDYLRDGKVYVSTDMCKEAILDEMDYFAISYQGKDVQFDNNSRPQVYGSVYGNVMLANNTSKIFQFVHLCLLHLPRPISRERIDFNVYKGVEKEFYGICTEMAEIIHAHNDVRKVKLLGICKDYDFVPQDIRFRQIIDNNYVELKWCVITLKLL